MPQLAFYRVDETQGWTCRDGPFHGVLKSWLRTALRRRSWGGKGLLLAPKRLCHKGRSVVSSVFHCCLLSRELNSSGWLQVGHRQYPCSSTSDAFPCSVLPSKAHISYMHSCASCFAYCRFKVATNITSRYISPPLSPSVILHCSLCI